VIWATLQVTACGKSLCMTCKMQIMKQRWMAKELRRTNLLVDFVDVPCARACNCDNNRSR